MSLRKVKSTSFALLLVLGLSGMSFGFLVGRSHQLSAGEASEQIQAVSGQVQNGGALVTKAFKGIRYFLIK